MKRCIVCLVVSLFFPAVLLAGGETGNYCLVSESEWSQCIELKPGGQCRISTETWEPTGKWPPSNLQRSVTPCRYTVQGDSVLVTYGAVTDILVSGIHDWDEFGRNGWSPGLKRVEPAPGESLLEPLVYWKEPRHDLRLRPRPR